MDKVPRATRKALSINVRDDNIWSAYRKILELLKQKSIHGETEGAVFACISRETGIKLPQVWNRIGELLGGEIVSRRTGPVRFELTQSGEEFLKDPYEFRRKAERELQIAQLEIQNDLMENAKRRAASVLMQDYFAIDEKWRNVKMPPSKSEIEEVKSTAPYLRSSTHQLKNAQPKCWVLKDKYDSEFMTYKVKVQEALEHCRKAIAFADVISTIEYRLRGIETDIEFLKEEWNEKNRRLIEGGWGSSFIDILANLRTRKQAYEEFDKRELEPMPRLAQEFKDYISLLELLSKPTHEWETVETTTLIEEAPRIKTDFGSGEPRPAVERMYVSKRKCKKCGCLAEQ